ncbi:MAG: mucoidy inhibitor MuiA family protein, partial [Flavobacteriales bacterium]|nr:mucoidy inhibitor MuiA family protein [Flavobacteriales bacterium]
MRSIIIIFCFCSLQVMALDTLSVKSKIEGVTVFLSGAQIERTAKVNVSKGKNVIVLEELSPEISSNSIQIKPGQGTLLGVEFGINYLKELPASNQLVKAYRDSLFDFELEKQINDGILETYAEEKKLLQENREIKLNERTLFLEDLEDMADFFRKRMSEINLKLMELKRTDNNLKKKIERLKRQLAQVNQPKTKPSGEITLALLSDVAGTVDIQIKYFVNQAGWKPFYDVRVNDVSKPLTLDYRAKVWQKSGIDWKNVKLVLSTSNPNKNNDRPVIRPWKLYLQNNTYAWQYGDVSKATRSRESDKKAYFAAEAESGVKLDGDFNTAADFTSLSESQTSYEFNIDLKYNVPSNGKEHDIYIQKNSIKADYQYYVAPRYRQEAFLIAKMVD